MAEGKIDVAGLLIWTAVGAVALAVTPIAEPIRKEIKGLFAAKTEPTLGAANLGELNAESAAPALTRPLQIDEQQELFRGMVAFLRNDFAVAVPIISKFAMMGDGRAQSAIGSMYYFGKGLPVDRTQALRWFAMAATQGNSTDRETLTAAVDGTLTWDDPVPSAFPGGRREVAQLEPDNALTDPTPIRSRRAFDSFSSGDPMAAVPIRPIPSSADRYGNGSASRGLLEAMLANPDAGRSHQSVLPDDPRFDSSASREEKTATASAERPAIVNRTPVILSPAGPGNYAGNDGDFYTQAGPHGVVNTRTGKFIPTN